jgi:hypothetical protein
MAVGISSLRMILPCLFLVASCALAPNPLRTEPSGDLSKRQIRRLAVMKATAVPEAERKMTAAEIGDLFNRALHVALAEFQDWQVVSEREVEEAEAALPAGLPEQERARRVGEMVHADAVLFGRVLYFRERVGEDKGVIRPASVAFVLNLLDVRRGDIVWRANYEETQRALSENLLAIATFAERGARWLKAEELVQEGIRKAVRDLHRHIFS